MNRFLTSVVAVVAGLAVASTVQAGSRTGSGNRSVSHVSHTGSPSFVKNSSQPSSQWQNYHGQKFSSGYYYSGRDHKNWSYCYWDRRYGCYLYWDPCYSSYYYYCAPQTCYYPVSYCPCNTYCWNQPAPVVSVPTVTATAIATVNASGGVAPGPIGGPAPGTPPPPPQGR